MDTYSINPVSIIDEAIDLSTRLTGTAFPVSIFPNKIQRIIREVHECHNYPTDYIAAAILTAIAVGIGNTHLAQIKQGWTESPILYMALIGRPGANKSHPLSFAMKPFLDYDYRQNQEFEKALAKYDELMSMSRKERAESGSEQFPQEPIRKRFLISDVTPEGLSLIHAQNKRGLCLWADELSAWFKNFNRYNNGSEEQFWLSVFSAKTTISDRKNAKSSIFIKRPYISVIGTIQKKILSELAKGERSSNGFIDRILFVMPNLQQKARWNDKELPENIEQEWNAIIDKLIQQEYALNEFGEIEPHILFFTEEAKKRLYEWQHHFSELCDRETNDTIVSIYCKLEIYIIRFCLIIQLARWTCGECDKTYIDLLTVERAIKLTEYFKESALSVQNILNENALNSQQQAIVNLLPPAFTTAQAIQIAEQNGMKERTLVIDSLSKTYAMTGWRIGYAAGPEELIRNMIKLQENVSACAATPCQVAAIEALEGSQDHLKYMVEQYRLRRDYVIQRIAEIPGLSCHTPAGTFYAFINISRLGMPCEEFAMKLLEEKQVVVVPGTAFGDFGEGYIRLSYATSMECLEQGLEALEEFVRAHAAQGDRA